MPQVEVVDGDVTEVARAQLAITAAAGRLVELLVKLTREQRRGGRLAAVRSLTDQRGD